MLLVQKQIPPQISAIWPVIFLALMLTVACKKEKKVSLPVVETGSVYNITKHSAQVNIRVTDEGGATVTAVGACWSENINPDLSSNVSNVGQGTGDFISILNDLDSNTTYYVRAYATNSAGTAYGINMMFTTAN